MASYKVTYRYKDDKRQKLHEETFQATNPNQLEFALEARNKLRPIEVVRREELIP